MTPGEWVTAASVAGCLLGAAVTFGIVWGVSRNSLKSLHRGHSYLSQEVKLHHENLEIHIDPKRDQKAEEKVQQSIDSGFDRMEKWLEKIDSRCEKRGATCADHFTAVEKKMVAIAAKAKTELQEFNT